MTRLLPVAAIVFALCAPAYAQTLDFKWDEDVKLPKKLKWEKMKSASKHKGYPNTVDNKERDRLYSLWEKEIAAKDNSDTSDVFPEEIFSVNLSLNGVTHRFSSAHMFYDGCSYFVENGSLCAGRYDAVDEKTGKVIHQQEVQMCLQRTNIEEKSRPQAKWGNEFAVDASNSTVYFRVLSNGSTACLYSVKLK
ncbi:MAG: hypothetical protein IKH84_00605 [Ottowia sp.]|nr:hypothetical protein [Ottowia sp.]